MPVRRRTRKQSGEGLLDLVGSVAMPLLGALAKGFGGGNIKLVPTRSTGSGRRRKH